MPSRAEDKSAPDFILEGIEQYKSATTEVEFSQAVRCFEEAVKLEPNYVPGRVWLGIAYMESASSQERYNNIIEQFETALTLPNPDNKYARYTKTATERLLRMRGRPNKVALYLTGPLANQNRQIATEALNIAKGKLTANGFDVVDEKAIGISTNVSDVELAVAGRRRAFGWIARASITRYDEGGWVNDKKSGKTTWSGMSLVMQISLLDCQLDRSLPEIEVRDVSSGDDREAAINSSVSGVGISMGSKLADVMKTEDKIIRDDSAVRSVPTNIPMVFAETSETDRKKARELPILVLPQVTDTSGNPDRLLTQMACMAAGLALRKELISSGRFAVVGQSELSRVADLLPSAWTPESMSEFAGKLGERCQVIMPVDMTRCTTRENNLLLATELKVAITLQTTPIVQGKLLPKALIGEDTTTKLAKIILIGGAKDELQTLMVEMAASSAKKISRQLSIAGTPAVIAICDFTAGKIQSDLLKSLGSFQERAFNRMTAVMPNTVLPIQEVNAAWKAAKNSKNRADALTKRGATICIIGKVEQVNVIPPAKGASTPVGKVAVIVSATLYGPELGATAIGFDTKKNKLTTIQEATELPIDLQGVVKGQKLELNADVQAVAGKAADLAMDKLIERIRACIAENEDRI
jgi:hypothetical protein